MTVWLVWTGQYSDAGVVGVYSTLALAESAAALQHHGWIDDSDGYEVDGDAPMIRAGISRWRVVLTIDDGAIKYADRDGIGTGAAAATTETFAFSKLASIDRLAVSCDARDKDHAIKIAGDERRKYLAAVQPDASR